MIKKPFSSNAPEKEATFNITVQYFFLLIDITVEKANIKFHKPSFPQAQTKVFMKYFTVRSNVRGVVQLFFNVENKLFFNR